MLERGVDEEAIVEAGGLPGVGVETPAAAVGSVGEQALPGGAPVSWAANAIPPRSAYCGGGPFGQVRATCPEAAHMPQTLCSKVQPVLLQEPVHCLWKQRGVPLCSVLFR